MSILELHKLLNSGKHYIKINQLLLSSLDLEQAALYSYLVAQYQKSIRNEDYKYFENNIYIFCPVDEIKKNIGLSAFRQRNVLNVLQNKKLLKVKLGKSRTRYIWINDDIKTLEYVMYGSKIDTIKAEFEKYVDSMAKKLVEKFSSKDDFNINQQHLFNYARKTDLYNQFSELGIGWLSQIEQQEQNKHTSKALLK